MSKDLSNYRKSYEKLELLEENCPENPMELFQTWFKSSGKSCDSEVIIKTASCSGIIKMY